MLSSLLGIGKIFFCLLGTTPVRADMFVKTLNGPARIYPPYGLVLLPNNLSANFGPVSN